MREGLSGTLNVVLERETEVVAESGVRSAERAERAARVRCAVCVCAQTHCLRGPSYKVSVSERGSVVRVRGVRRRSGAQTARQVAWTARCWAHTLHKSMKSVSG